MAPVLFPKKHSRFDLSAVPILTSLLGAVAMGGPVVWNDASHTKVACTGASITWGYWDDLIMQGKSYPDQLQQLLGQGYTVRNYGVSSMTAGRYPNYEHRAYYHTGEQVGCVQWRPNIVIAGLGVNDCNALWADPVRYEQGYRELAAAWRSPGQNPDIWIWNRFTPDFRGPVGVAGFPGNVFGPKYVFNTDDNGMAAKRGAVQNRVDSFAPDLGAGTIDVYSQLAIHPEWSGDGLHVTGDGLRRLSELVYVKAWEDLAKSRTPVLAEVCPTPGSDSPRDETNSNYPWVEIYNPYPQGVCLDGLAIDKGAGTPQFVFAQSTVLFPGERRVIFLSGKNLTQPTKPIHANFSVTGSEGQIRLLSRTGTVVDTMGWRNWYVQGSLGRADGSEIRAVGISSPHRRLVTSTPHPNWFLPGFDDSSWTTGTGGTGFEFPVRPEGQFGMRWECNGLNSGYWQVLNGAGAWTSGGGAIEADGQGPSLSLKGGHWIEGVDSSWTVEARIKLRSPAEGTNDGFMIRAGTQNVGGGYGILWIEPGRVLFGNIKSIANTLSTAANDDDYHVFRVAYHAPTRRFFVWRDGVQITCQEGGQKKDTSRFNWLTLGALTGTQNMAASLDYVSVDRNGAFAPAGPASHVPVGNESQQALTNDSIAPHANGSASTLVRIPFQNNVTGIAAIKLGVQFDDGFRAWINGAPVASCNAPSSGLTATQARDDARGIDTVTLDLSEYIPILQQGTNVLALQALDSNVSDGRCFIRGTLDIRQIAETSGRYYSPVTAGQTNGAGAVLPAQGWLLQPDSPPTGSLPLTLRDDTDGDGNSNLLEHMQGTNPSVYDSAGLTVGPATVNFKWRNNPEVGWRLMECVDGVNWRPARTQGAPTSTPSGTSGMLDVSQPVLTTVGITFRLAAVEQPSLENWRLQYFTATEINAGTLVNPAADPDQDGLPNFLEFAIASNPRSGEKDFYGTVNPGGMIGVPDIGTGRGTLWFLERSGNLQNWQGVANPILNCKIDPRSGRYLILATAPGLQSKEYIRARFLPSN
ncbi:GDSL-type esterase/lipase family protein [Luteolibacter sp. GHJ8]|uniref:GDSL-type esterase/lipase family protein n=1 Tax=Luteolibacter rhizosphaerae TaxID=2989719 RepID=A0ABT3FZD0_9BACT|nr:GDSL-type esterase/lipase family protein [Luteolibacter rhizosphaerae]MCW1912684.1 GDSL-type esterase/lipase family protein [Luteolibacter rhizosphaerae]